MSYNLFFYADPLKKKKTRLDYSIARHCSSTYEARENVDLTIFTSSRWQKNVDSNLRNVQSRFANEKKNYLLWLLEITVVAREEK